MLGTLIEGDLGRWSQALPPTSCQDLGEGMAENASHSEAQKKEFYIGLQIFNFAIGDIYF